MIANVQSAIFFECTIVKTLDKETNKFWAILIRNGMEEGIESFWLDCTYSVSMFL